MEEREHYAFVFAMSNDIDIPYDIMAEELKWLSARPLEHARSGFEYWYAAFKKIPQATNIQKVDNLAVDYILKSTQHSRTNMNTVAIAMQAFMNALRNQYAFFHYNALLAGGTGLHVMMNKTNVFKERLDYLAKEHSADIKATAVREEATMWPIWTKRAGHGHRK
jgi:hypothetical protein